MRKNGYTVIELLVVIAIIGIVLGITLPRLGRSGEGTKLSTAVDMLRGSLETARLCAATTHAYCAVGYDNAAHKVVLRKQDTDDVNNNSDTTEMIVFEKGFDVPRGITVTFPASSEVRYNPYGGIEGGSTATIVIQSTGLNKSRTLTINAKTGYVSSS